MNNSAFVFVGVSRIFLLGILIFKGLTARRLYKSFVVKGLNAARASTGKVESIVNIIKAECTSYGRREIQRLNLPRRVMQQNM
jgi:hypothetical protein